MAAVLWGGRLALVFALVLALLLGGQQPFIGLTVPFEAAVAGRGGGVRAADGAAAAAGVGADRGDRRWRTRGRCWPSDCCARGGWSEIARSMLWGAVNGTASHAAGDRLPAAGGVVHPGDDEPDADGAGGSQASAAPAPVAGGAGDVRAHHQRGQPGRGGLQRHRRQRAAGAGGRVLPRHRQDHQAAVLHREPAARAQSARQAQAGDERGGRAQPRGGGAAAGDGVPAAAGGKGLHRAAPRHAADLVLPGPGAGGGPGARG